MFVTAENFNTPPYDLPKLEDVPNAFDNFVTEQEDIELTKIFGVTFYEAFKAALAALPEDWNDQDYITGNRVVYGNNLYTALQDSANVIPSSDNSIWQDDGTDRWLKVKNGEAYEDENNPARTYKWNGMVVTVKYMIHSLWLRYVINDTVTPNAVVVASTENSTAISPNVRLCESWNKFVREVKGMRTQNFGYLFAYLYYNSTTFDDVTPNYPSFREYLNTEFQCPKTINVFDI